MTDIRDAMERATSSFAPSTDWLDGTRDRVRHRARARRVLAGAVALGLFVSTFVFLLVAVRPGGQGGIVGAPVCTRAWTSTELRAPAAFSTIVGAASDDAWAIGPIPQYVPGSRTQIAHWDGAAWTAVPSPNGSDAPQASNNLMDAVAISSTDVWAVGEYDTAFPLTGETPGRGLITHWDGNRWKTVDTPDLGGEETRFAAVDASGPDDVWVVGLTAETSAGQALVEHWDGHRWSVLPSPAPPRNDGNGSSLNAVAAFSPADVWVFGSAGPDYFSAHWDGNAWQRMSIADSGDSFASWEDAVRAPSGAIWLLGYGYPNDGPGHGTIAHFDGTSWSVGELPAPPLRHGALSDLAVAGESDVWATGWMGDSDSLPEGYPGMRPWVVHLDNETWTTAPVFDETSAQMDGAGTAGGDIWLTGHHGGDYGRVGGYLSGEDPLIAVGGC